MPYTFDSRIRYSETGCEGYLTLPALINYFQDVSTFQSEDLGVGFQYNREHKIVWVLSFWQIVVERYPKLGEKVTAGTFPTDFKRFLGIRNFFLKDAEGNYLAKANSLWSLLNTETGGPALPTEKMLDRYAVEEKLDMAYAPRKIPVPEGGAAQEPVLVKKHHLDTNHHVNNEQYISIAAEFLPENFVIRELRAEYKKQAFLDDILYPFVAVTEGGYIVTLTDDGGKPYLVAEFLER